MDTTNPSNEPQASTALDPGDQPLSPDEEILEIEKLLATEPDDFQARCRLGELYFSKGRLDDALELMHRLAEQGEPESLVTLGNFYWQGGPVAQRHVGRRGVHAQHRLGPHEGPRREPDGHRHRPLDGARRG